MWWHQPSKKTKQNKNTKQPSCAFRRFVFKCLMPVTFNSFEKLFSPHIAYCGLCHCHTPCWEYFKHEKSSMRFSVNKRFIWHSQIFVQERRFINYGLQSAKCSSITLRSWMSLMFFIKHISLKAVSLLCGFHPRYLIMV